MTLLPLIPVTVKVVERVLCYDDCEAIASNIPTTIRSRLVVLYVPHL